MANMLETHTELFKVLSYGEIQDFTAKVRVQEGTKPIFHNHVDCLQKNKIITKVARSDWAAPIVVVPKKDKTVRMCGNYKVTVNRCILPEEYPLPKAEDLFATLAGGKVFNKLDLAFAYQQLKLDPESEQCLTINTHKGLFRFNRLAYGISTAPAIFQHTMDQILDGIDNVVCFMDDILVSAPTIGEHLVVLDKVMSRLEKYGVKMKHSKCEFLQDSVEYLGYKIDAQGLHPTNSKVEAIVNTPAPTNISELRSFLGLLNYYGKFVANLSTLLHPLHQLLQADKKWNWSPQCEETFKTCKQRLLKSKWLAHYNTEMKLRLACDASPYGVGAVISHVLPSGEEHPIAFASQTLSPCEKNYAQIEKEALSIIFGVKKFHKYLYRRKLQLLTDHKLLLAILGPKSAIPTLAAFRNATLGSDIVSLQLRD
uniref:ribonuclease H n=1 Tax=Oncorhynchus tshawytscha TaxID=74940 RepID=A0AAZ3QFN7_ONCTS